MAHGKLKGALLKRFLFDLALETTFFFKRREQQHFPSHKYCVIKVLPSLGGMLGHLDTFVKNIQSASFL